jgi:hypothetical protein
MSKKARLVVVGVVVVLSVLIALLANFLISKSKIKEPQTKPNVEKVARKTSDSSVNFGEDISSLRDLNKGDIANRIQAFNETYDLGIEDTSVTSLTWKSSGVVVTNSVEGYEFITDYYGSVLGFISRSTLSSSSLKKVSSSFSVISLGDGRALYLGAITNGLVGKEGKPLIKVNRLSGSEIPSSTNVEIEKLPAIWEDLGISDDSLEFTRFIVSPSGVELAEYIDEDGNYLYYSLYSVAEDGKQVIRGKFSGIMTTKYSAKITDLFVKNVSQFGIFEVKDGGILWVTY